MARVCWLCEKEVAKGTPLKDDQVLSTIREGKKKLGILKGNELVVCDEHLEAYRGKRKSFEKKLVLYATFAVIVAIGFPLLPLLLGGGFQLEMICFSFILAVMILALSILNYVPALEGAPQEGKPARKTAAKPAAPKPAAAPKRKKGGR